MKCLKQSYVLHLQIFNIVKERRDLQLRSVCAMNVNNVMLGEVYNSTVYYLKISPETNFRHG